MEGVFLEKEEEEAISRQQFLYLLLFLSFFLCSQRFDCYFYLISKRWKRHHTLYGVLDWGFMTYIFVLLSLERPIQEIGFVVGA